MIAMHCKGNTMAQTFNLQSYQLYADFSNAEYGDFWIVFVGLPTQCHLYSLHINYLVCWNWPK